MINIILLLSLLTLSLSDEQSSCSSSYVPGPFTYTTSSASSTAAATTVTGYLMQFQGSKSVTTTGSQVTVGLNGSPRFYLSNTCASSFTQNIFQKFNLIGATISFTVDLSGVGCGQNAAFYFVGMPAGSAGGGDFYCDANCVGGYCCYEMDVMEANRHALQITPHKCTSLSGGCDPGGCALNSQSITNGFGYGTSFTINTQNPFNVKMTFNSQNSQLTGITTVISQSTKSITLTHPPPSTSNCAPGYLQAMSAGMSVGMVPVWSFWTGPMSWLDSPACPSDTNDVTGTNQFIFSNLAITNTGPITAPPPPPPVPPASQYCGNQGCTINANFVEFTSPHGSSSSPAPVVKCSNGVQCGSPCNWFASGNKWQCACGSSTCASPVPYVNGVACPIVYSAALGDSTAQSSGSLDSSTIAIIAVGSVIGVLLVIVIIVLVVVRKTKVEEFV